MERFCFIIVVYSFFHLLEASTIRNAREMILWNEDRLAVGGTITLSDKEAVVNDCLMQYKLQELDFAFDNPQYFNFSRHYFTYKDNIQDSKVYQIIKDTPKGAVLHNHDRSTLGPDYLMNITYLDHLYFCIDEDNISFKFSNCYPQSACSGHWQLMAEARRKSNDITNFDAELRKRFTLVVDDPETTYPSHREVWDAFTTFIKTITSLLIYRPIWEQYYHDALKQFYEQKIMYVEFRSEFPNLYELDGTVHDALTTAKIIENVVKRFKKMYPDFIGCKLIYSPNRYVDTAQVDEYIQLAKIFKQEIPELFAGFDLCQEEDKGKPLVDFLPQLKEASKDLDFFFHAGETNWYGTTSDENLVDAILLGTKRLGHAFALPKHPVLMEMVKQNDIAIEVNVISSEVLSFVRHVRNHPLAVFISNGLPVVLSSDGPGAWESDAISEDLYVAFVGVVSRQADLSLLKALALNSLKYSALSPQEKSQAIKYFHVKWNQFIDNFDCSAY